MTARRSRSCSIAVRGGNTSEPDGAWSDWSAEFSDPAKAVFGGPACRFAQFRATMKSDDGKTSPALHTVSLLRYHTSKGAFALHKVLISAIANAQENASLSPESLRIKSILVDEGPRLKRMQARAMGRGNRIIKKTSHITVVVEDYDVPRTVRPHGTKAKPRPTFGHPGRGKKAAATPAAAVTAPVIEPEVEEPIPTDEAIVRADEAAIETSEALEAAVETSEALEAAMESSEAPVAEAAAAEETPVAEAPAADETPGETPAEPAVIGWPPPPRPRNPPPKSRHRPMRRPPPKKREQSNNGTEDSSRRLPGRRHPWIR